MKTNPWPSQASKLRFYGNPDANRNGLPDTKWAKENLVQIVPPYPMYYPTSLKDKRGKRWSKLTVHKKVADSLLECLREIPKVCTPEEIKKYELDLCGGAYVFRLKRNGTSLSEHSWGIAIDLSHLINYYGRAYDPSKNMMPLKVAKIFQDRGWTWLKRKDAMHFQAVSIT